MEEKAKKVKKGYLVRKRPQWIRVKNMRTELRKVTEKQNNVLSWLTWIQRHLVVEMWTPVLSILLVSAVFLLVTSLSYRPINGFSQVLVQELEQTSSGSKEASDPSHRLCLAPHLANPTCFYNALIFFSWS